jgi:hypothetical protein
MPYRVGQSQRIAPTKYSIIYAPVLILISNSFEKSVYTSHGRLFGFFLVAKMVGKLA